VIINSDEIMLLKDVLSWMRGLVETVSLMEASELTKLTVQIAGVPIEILSNDPSLLLDYRGRWYGGTSNCLPLARIFVLSGGAQVQTIPQISVFEISPAQFHQALAAEDIIATYPTVKGQMQFMDRRRRIAIHIFGNRAQLAPWDESAPLRLPFQWIIAQENLRLAHAAAIGIDGKGLILFGKGGAGKSGTTLAALAVGMSTVGDDYIALGVASHPFARAVFNHVKQDDEGISRIPGLQERVGHVVKNWRGKAEFQPDLIFTGAFVDEISISAAVLPSITNQVRPRITPISPADALLALISSNAQYDPLRPDAGLRFFADFLRKIPCYRMDLSSHALDNGLALKALLAELGR
jgi:hypothetical protein